MKNGGLCDFDGLTVKKKKITYQQAEKRTGSPTVLEYGG